MGSVADHMPGPDERQLAYDVDMIERALWEVALHGGSSTKAAKALADWALDTAGDGVPPVPTPTDRTIRSWLRGRFRDRYLEIRETRARELEERIAQGNVESALQLEHLEQEATRRALARLPEANAVEASMVMRNASQAKAMNIERAGQIRNREGFQTDVRSIAQILAGLQHLGAAHVDGTIADAEVVPAPQLGA